MFRKTPRLFNELIERLQREGKPMESLQILAAVELLLERVYAAVKVLLVLILILFTMLVGLAWSTTNVSRSADDAKVAATRADKNLTNAVNGSKAASEASASAIDSIHRIEQYLCGGICPVRTVTPTATTTTTTTVP